MEFARVSPTQAHLLHEARVRPFPTNFCRKSQDKAIRGRVVGGRWQIKMPAPPPSPLWQTMEQARVTAMATNPYLPTPGGASAIACPFLVLGCANNSDGPFHCLIAVLDCTIFTHLKLWIALARHNLK